jgi:toxin ParE1/3/4
LKVIFSATAELDLEGIADWIAQDNPDRARTFVAELVEAAKSIGRAPRSYPSSTRIVIRCCGGAFIEAT